MSSHRSLRVVLTGLIVALVAGSIASPAAGSKPHHPGVIGFVGPPRSVTVPAGPVPKQWLQVVNYYRNLAGLAPVTEDPTLTDHDKKHAKWMVKNQTIMHGETNPSPFYTPGGDTAGHNSNILSGSWGQTDRTSIEQWITAPFHAVGVLDPKLATSGYGDFQETTPPGKFPYAAALDVLSDQSATPADPTWPVMFPDDGKKVFLKSYPGAEHPDPLSSCSGYNAPTGLPIYLMLTTTPASVTATFKQHGGSNLPSCIFDETNYVNGNSGDQSNARAILAGRHAIVLIPKNPLKSNKTYDVSITSNATPYSWSFQVGDVTPPKTTMVVPANGQVYDRDKFHKIKGTATGKPVRVDVELHRIYNGGLCTFWTGSKFTNKRSCSQPVWLKANGTGSWSLSVPKLPASTSGLHNYIARSRGTDNAGNVEGYATRNFHAFHLSP